jgi:hypothetical protein
MLIGEPLEVNLSSWNVIDGNLDNNIITIDGSNLAFQGFVSTTKKQEDPQILTNTTRIQPQLSGFNVGVKFINASYDPRKMYFDFWLLIKNQTGEAYYEKVGTRACTLDDFPTELQSDLEIIDVSSYYCPMQENFGLSGNQYSNEYTILEINSVICYNETANDTCEDLATIYTEYYQERM